MHVRLTLDEIAAAAELILAQDVAESKEGSGSESSDEGFGGEVESDVEDDKMETDNTKSLGDSGYAAHSATGTRYADNNYRHDIIGLNCGNMCDDLYLIF